MHHRTGFRELRWGHTVLVGLFAILPITATAWSFDQFELPKESLYLFGFLLYLLFGATVVLKNGGMSRISIRNSWLPLFALVVVVAWGLSPYRYLGQHVALVVLVSIAVIWLLATQVSTRLLSQCLWAMMISGWINASFAVLQFFNRDPIFINAAGGQDIFGRHFAGGFLGNPNLLGIFLAHAIISSAVLTAWNWRRPFLRYLALSSLIYFSLVSLLVQALAALVALAGSAVVGLAIIYPVCHVSRRTVLKILLPSAVIGILVFAWILTLDSHNASRVRNVFRGVTEADWELATHGRFHTARVAWVMTTDRFWIGHGPGTFAYLYFPYRIQLYPGRVDKIANPGQYAVEVHNEYLQGAVEFGWPAVWLVVVGLLVLGSKTWAIMMRKLPDLSTLPRAPDANSTKRGKKTHHNGQYPAVLEWLGAAWALLILVCTLINSLANFTLHTPHSVLPSVLAVGYLLGYTQDSLIKTNPVHPGTLRKGGRWIQVVLAILFLGVSVSLGRVYWASCLERSAYLSLVRWQQGAQQQGLTKISSDILRDLERAARMDPGNFHVSQMLGAVYLINGDPAMAEEALSDSLRYRVDPETLLNYGITLNELGRKQEALETFRRGLLYLPDHAKLNTALDVLQRQIGYRVFLPLVTSQPGL